mmetsp:Transcript_120514/g.323553  ORF Transcript_120514/g.323553 Transcript_120514/m.323553 type:complete len:276 (-) Transcript_120514:573-1400(-)
MVVVLVSVVVVPVRVVVTGRELVTSTKVETVVMVVVLVEAASVMAGTCVEVASVEVPSATVSTPLGARGPVAFAPGAPSLAVAFGPGQASPSSHPEQTGQSSDTWSCATEQASWRSLNWLSFDHATRSAHVADTPSTTHFTPQPKQATRWCSQHHAFWSSGHRLLSSEGPAPWQSYFPEDAAAGVAVAFKFPASAGSPPSAAWPSVDAGSAPQRASRSHAAHCGHSLATRSRARAQGFASEANSCWTPRCTHSWHGAEKSFTVHCTSQLAAEGNS